MPSIRLFSRAFLESVHTHDYITLLAYLPTHQGWEEKLQPLRDRLLQRLNVATCVALGPRYLHSSGQLHKGGKKNGHFVVLTATSGQRHCRSRRTIQHSATSSTPRPGATWKSCDSADKGSAILIWGPLDAADAKIKQLTKSIG